MLLTTGSKMNPMSLVAIHDLISNDPSNVLGQVTEDWLPKGSSRVN